MTIHCKGKLIDLSTPKVMGVLNLTPDSFYDGGRHETIDSAVVQAYKMLEEGATFIDVGAYSSRPGATDISAEEEEKRLLPVLKELLIQFPEILVSVDTFRASVAEKAVQHGAALINDISAGKIDENMLKIVGSLGVPYCMMHMKGTPQTMKNLAQYKNITQEIIYYFSERLEAAFEAKINDIMIDPGFGFAKTVAQNFQLLSELDLLKILEMPLLVGVSRKSMIYKTLEITSDQALNGTSVLNTIALVKNASILRVHDVAPAIECIKLYTAL